MNTDAAESNKEDRRMRELVRLSEFVVGDIQMQKITAEEWHRIPCNPRQRDINRHLKKAILRHLNQSNKIQSIVFAGIYPNGKLVKLDGYTRDEAWTSGCLEKPNTLHMIIIAIADEDEAKQLYNTFDSRDALETAADQMTGAIHEHEIDFQSSMLRHGNGAHALRMLFEQINRGKQSTTYKSVGFFKQELELLDQCEPKTSIFTTPILMAAIASFILHGENISEFWLKLSRDEGTKMDGQMDAVEALSQMIKRMTGKNLGGGQTWDAFYRTLNCVDAFLTNRKYSYLKNKQIKTMPKTSRRRTLERLRDQTSNRLPNKSLETAPDV